jgi:hypothetical protein
MIWLVAARAIAYIPIMLLVGVPRSAATTPNATLLECVDFAALIAGPV